jgi:uncharacterized delta-60 repeat protein
MPPPVNDAPTLNDTSPTLGSVPEGATHPTGITVAALVVDGSITGPDGAVEAIAITALNTSLGTWQYSLDGGFNWLTIRADLINSSANELALLLGSNDQIRLLPFGDLNGALSDAITFRAWDQSSGTAGQYVVIPPGGTGGSSAFSSASDTASLTVTPVNDAPTFAPLTGSGWVAADLGGNTDYGLGVVLQPDGRIVVAGFGNATGTAQGAVLRFTADGRPDTGFDTNGQVLTSVDLRTQFADVALQPDGRIVATGVTADNVGGADRIVVARYKADGTLDTAFGSAGTGATDIGGVGNVGGSALSPDGKIVIAGSAWNSSLDWTVLRYDTNGNLDTSFNGSGKVLTDFGGSFDIAHAVALQADGKILVAGGRAEGGSYDFAVARYKVDGSLDADFDGDGWVRSDFTVNGFDIALAIAVQSNGRIVVAGHTDRDGSIDVALARYLDDGSLDTSFGGGTGLVVTDIAGGSDDRNVSAMALQADGKILVAGFTSNPMTADYVVLRYNPDGSLDTSFNGTGKRVIDVSGSADYLADIKVQADGKIVLVGNSFVHSVGNFDIVVMRLNPDGSLDGTFAGTAADTLGDTVDYTENGAPVALDSSVAIFDGDLTALNGGRGDYFGSSLTLARSGGASTQDLLTLDATGALFTINGNNLKTGGQTFATFSSSGGTLTLNFGGMGSVTAATQALVNDVLSHITYANSSDAPPSVVTLAWTFNDGSGAANATATGTTAVNITPVNDAPTGGVSITGALVQGQVLNADTHTLGDVDGLGTLHYQWLRGGVAIAGAPDAATYTTVLADVGATISLRVSYTDGDHTAESVLSPSTTTIGAPLTPPAGLPTLIGPNQGKGQDVLQGTNQAEVLLGGTSSDSLNGGGGDDWLDGGAGGDTLSGGSGNDTYVVDSRWDWVNEAYGEGNDTVIASISYVLGFNQENLYLSGSAHINATGNADANLLIGNAGNNTLAGRLGNDTLIGGDGQDVFVFDTAPSATNRDTIHNFIVADDTIQLNRSVFSALTPGVLAPDAFVTGAAALDANDRIIYNSATGALLYDADGSGAGAAVQFATLVGVVGTLSAADFVVV